MGTGAPVADRRRLASSHGQLGLSLAVGAGGGGGGEPIPCYSRRRLVAVFSGVGHRRRSPPLDPAADVGAVLKGMVISHGLGPGASSPTRVQSSAPRPVARALAPAERHILPGAACAAGLRFRAGGRVAAARPLVRRRTPFLRRCRKRGEALPLFHALARLRTASGRSGGADLRADAHADREPGPTPSGWSHAIADSFGWVRPVRSCAHCSPELRDAADRLRNFAACRTRTARRERPSRSVGPRRSG